jgi:hypothetical protein
MNLAVHLDDNLKAISPSRIRVDSHANSVRFRFSSRRYAEDVTGSLRIDGGRENNGQEPLLPDAALQYRLGEAPSFWFQLIGALLLLSLVTTALGLDFSKVEPLSVCGVMQALWPKILLAPFQALLLFWLFFLVGKKVL